MLNQSEEYEISEEVWNFLKWTRRLPVLKNNAMLTFNLKFIAYWNPEGA